MAGTKRERSPGKWTLTVTLGVDYTGKKIRYNKSFHGSAAEAEKALALFYSECVNNEHSRGSVQTVDDLVTCYVNERPKDSLKQNTIEGYNKIIRNYISPLIGKEKVNKLTPRKVQQWVNDLSEQYSVKTIENTVGLLSAAFEHEIKMDRVGSNPCKRILMPKKHKVEADCYDEYEVAAFIDALSSLADDDLVYKVMFELALFCGLRKNELLGLDLQDVDLNSCTVTIRQGRHRKDGGGVRLDTPKTEKSRRTVGFPTEIRKDIVRLMSFYSDQALRLGSEWNASTALFRGPFGNPICTTSPLRRLHKFQEENGLRKITLHQLRHTNASIMISSGLDLKTMQERGGWSNSSILLNTYGHLFKKQDEKVTDQIYKTATAHARK